MRVDVRVDAKLLDCSLHDRKTKRHHKVVFRMLGVYRVGGERKHDQDSQ